MRYSPDGKWLLINRYWIRLSDGLRLLAFTPQKLVLHGLTLERSQLRAYFGMENRRKNELVQVKLVQEIIYHDN
jgi:hypothetical protein